MWRLFEISDRAEEKRSAGSCSLSSQAQLFPIGMEIQNMYHNKTAGTRRKMILETDRQEHNLTAVMIYAHHARLPFSALSINYHRDAFREDTSKRLSHEHSV